MEIKNLKEDWKYVVVREKCIRLLGQINYFNLVL